jgi:hypothetical protein
VLSAVALVAAVVLSLAVVRWMAGRGHAPVDGPAVRVFGRYSPFLTWLDDTLHHPFSHAGAERLKVVLRGKVGSGIELALIALWAMWIGRNLLNFDPHIWPIGREFGIDIYAFHFWDFVRDCGLCSLWNGMLNGGSPFLADPFTGHLHPLPALATLLAGVVNGAKITIVTSFFLAESVVVDRPVMGLGRWSACGQRCRTVPHLAGG